MDRIRSIVVPTDFSPLAEAAAARAATLARLDRSEIHLLHAARFPLVATPYDVSVPEAVWQRIRASAEEKLEVTRAALAERLEPSVTAEITESSDPAQAIADAVRAHDADLVVMGTHGYGGIQHAFLGSVAERTLRLLDQPVLVVKESPAQAAEPITRILLGVDFSVHSDRAVEVVAALASRLGAAVDVVHAFDLPSDYAPYATPFASELEAKIQDRTAERLEDIRKRLEGRQLNVTLHARRGRPSLVIAEIAAETGSHLIVVGTRGSSGLAHVLLGSVAERTIRTSPCSVLAVKAEGPPQ